MERSEIIFLTGLIIALIWLFLCIFIEGKNRKYIIIFGIVMDIVLFAICQNCEMLLIGLAGGLACGLIPQLTSVRKYRIAVREMNGIRNWLIVSIILFIMIFLTISVAHPELTIDLG